MWTGLVERQPPGFSFHLPRSLSLQLPFGSTPPKLSKTYLPAHNNRSLLTNYEKHLSNTTTFITTINLMHLF
jgi:hypothetical protein